MKTPEYSISGVDIDTDGYVVVYNFVEQELGDVLGIECEVVPPLSSDIAGCVGGDGEPTHLEASPRLGALSSMIKLDGLFTPKGETDAVQKHRLFTAIGKIISPHSAVPIDFVSKS